MTERDHVRQDDERDVTDHPEWSESDIRAGLSLADFAPAVSERIARALGRPAHRRKHPDENPDSERQENGAS